MPKPLKRLARETGLEPAASAVTGRREGSNFNPFRLRDVEIGGCKARVSTLGVETGPQGVKRLPKPDGTVAWYWVASQLHRNTKGFRPRTQLLWRGPGVPGPDDMALIRRRCDRLTAELGDWLKVRNRVRPNLGEVYFLEGADGIKIGFSADPTRRHRALQTGSARPLVLLATMPALARTERHLHQQFRHLKISGEWFRDDPALRAYIAARCAS